MNEFKPAFVVIPKNIFDIPDISISALRVYETIFQYWHNAMPCYISNEIIMEKTGIKSRSTVKDAIVFFENLGHMKRVMRNGTRYLVSTKPKELKYIDDENDEDESYPQGGADPSAGGADAAAPIRTNNCYYLKAKKTVVAFSDCSSYNEESISPPDQTATTRSNTVLNSFTESNSESNYKIPTGFEISEINRGRCREREMDVNQVFNNFWSYHERKKTIWTSTDHIQAAFTGWIRRHR